MLLLSSKVYLLNKFLIIIFLFFIFLVLSATSSLSQDIGKSAPAPTELDGKGLYIHCARCHKHDGVGGPSYGGYAANLRETMLDHEELVMVITEGRRTLGMPEFKSRLSKREINALATYIEREFKGKPLE